MGVNGFWDFFVIFFKESKSTFFEKFKNHWIIFEMQGRPANPKVFWVFYINNASKNARWSSKIFQIF